ncbi:hypothetical protein V8E53_012687 [Lactarius tabidus]
MSCNRCKGTTTNPHNFLLSCSECDKRWHHRCHIPPLSDAELTALIRATNDNDIDNGLSSWIGRCCKKKRAKAQAIPEAVSRPPVVPKPQVHSASPAPAVSPNSSSIRQVSQQPDLSSVPTQSIHHHDQTRQSTSHDGVAAPLKPRDEQATRDLSLTDPQTPTMASSVWPAVQRSMTVSPEMAAAQPERSRTMPLPSTSYMASPSGNVASTSVADSHPAARLRENSLPLVRTPPSQPTSPTYVQAPSQSSKRASASGNVDPVQATSPEPMEIDIDSDLPTLDLGALTLNRAPSSHHKTASRTHSPAPPTHPSAAEDDEIEDLYGPPIGLPSVHAPPSLPPPEPPQPASAPAPAPKELRILPVLAAEDPRIRAALERHVQREAARPRQGMRKAPAVRRAGAKRGGFVLVADYDRPRTEVGATATEPRGVFASYFARSDAAEE